MSGGLADYYFGARLMECILPKNSAQRLVKVPIAPPDGQERAVEEGIYGKSEVMEGIEKAKTILKAEDPSRAITIGGNCLVSLAPFDYLHGKYKKAAVVWIDAHPDVSTATDGYPCAHAMVLGTLLGSGEKSLTTLVENPFFVPEEILYVGLQGLHDYQKKFLDERGVRYRVQTDSFVTSHEIEEFVKGFDHLLVHLDIDVLVPRLFHSAYCANPELSGDGSGGGKMTIDTLSSILGLVTGLADVVGFTIAEYLPFNEYRLHKMFSRIKLFTE